MFMAKHKQKSYNTPPHLSYPAISIIIPLYNVEKYVGECLDSLLAQTFQNFEVIVVDDCSTDSSCVIVESYKEKFGGRLNLLHMRKKSNGGGYLPRNRGVEYSCGKYICFLDGDDALTLTALEELYEIAEKFMAEVVRCENYYKVHDEFWNHDEYRKNLKPSNYLTGEKILVTEPLIWENNFEERIKYFVQKKLIWNVWGQLIRRDFILKNNLKMPDAVAQDMTFTICEICCAKKFVVVPNVVNYYRNRPNSVSTEKINVVNLIYKWLNSTKYGVKFIDEFLSEREFFTQRPDLKYLLFDAFSQEMLRHLNEIYAQIPTHALDELIRKEFSDGDNLALTSYIFNKMNVQRVQFMQAQYKFNQFAQQAQKRIAELEAEIKRFQTLQKR